MGMIIKISRRFIILLCCMLVSCNTSQKIVYMQDAVSGITNKTVSYMGIVIQPKDVLSIVVNSKDPELAVGFNLQMFPSTTGGYSSYMDRLGYQVDLDGNIDFPILGKLKVAGLTREQVSSMIQEQISSEGLIKDAIVTTEYMNFKVSVLGEVRNPGTFSLTDDRITILEALGKAGDLTIYGRRDNVLVSREKEGRVIFYRVDLRTEALLTSPAYYLQQNDVVYVQPNNTVIARSRINENRSVSVWISIASLLTSLTILLK